MRGDAPALMIKRNECIRVPWCIKHPGRLETDSQGGTSDGWPACLAHNQSLVSLERSKGATKIFDKENGANKWFQFCIVKMGRG